MYLLIDESGRLYDSEDKFLILVAIYSSTLVGLDKIAAGARARIPKKGKRRRERFYEIKFSYAGDKTKRYVLNRIAHLDVEIYGLIISKEGRRILDTPLNYAILIATLLNLIREKEIQHLIIDRHFTNKKQVEEFNSTLKKLVRKKIFVEHINSEDNPALLLPDFVAGSIRVASTMKSDEFQNLIASRIKKLVEMTWRQIKKR